MANDIKIKTPTIFTIFGASGDLAKKKLLPALLDLYVRNLLPKKFRIVGFALDDYSDATYRKFVRRAIANNKHGHLRAKVKAFLKNIHYEQGLFENVEAYTNLTARISGIEKEYNACANIFLYLAVPPKVYAIVLKNLKKSKLTVSCVGGKSWMRVLVEKPFGRDLKTARELNTKLKTLFIEEQIFRIDHYLAKETVQNLLSFRFSNTLFESAWDKDYIERVEIKLREKKGIEGRERFYDDVGAFRDVGQNHMLQLLALVAMEYPGKLEADTVRKKRAAILEALTPLTGKTISQNSIQGQYIGYRGKRGVPQDSTTETYFKIKTFINDERWKGIPFYLESGKRLGETKTKITIYLKKAQCLCAPEFEKPHQNRIVFRIQPNEGISVVFWVKKPGFTMELEEKKLTFYYHETEPLLKLPDAYEKVLYDCLRGDQTLFASTREVEASWKFISPIIKKWNTEPPLLYKQGSYGPSKRLTF
ncbi:glucose-6-phosphate dehydrogenase [Patescibacteria group bacterium]|nr:glucose-6-phosphate dehydrogenase [Patescibacteria group bacterium]